MGTKRIRTTPYYPNWIECQYDGSFEVTERPEKYFTIIVKGKSTGQLVLLKSVKNTQITDANHAVNKY